MDKPKNGALFIYYLCYMVKNDGRFLSNLHSSALLVRPQHFLLAILFQILCVFMFVCVHKTWISTGCSA